MTLGAREPQHGDVGRQRPARTGFRIALAAWIPLIFFVLLAMQPPMSEADCDESTGFLGCVDGRNITLVLFIFPMTVATIGLAAWASRRAAAVLDAASDSPEAERASAALYLSGLAAAGTVVAWLWLWFWRL